MEVQRVSLKGAYDINIESINLFSSILLLANLNSLYLPFQT